MKPGAIKYIILYWILGFFIGIPHHLNSQDRAVSDSLEYVLNTGNYQEKQFLSLLRDLAVNHPLPEKTIYYSELLIDEARKRQNDSFLYSGYLERGNGLRLKGELVEALSNFIKSAEVSSSKLENHKLNISYFSMADTYSIMGNGANAIHYYNRSIELSRSLRDTLNLATALTNAGDEYFNAGNLDSALLYFNESGKLFDRLDYPLGVAYNLGNTGLVHAKQGLHDLAEEEMSQAIQMLEIAGDYYPISVYLNYLADIYKEEGRSRLAEIYVQRSLEIARKYELKKEISDAHLKLASFAEHGQDYQEALNHYKQHVQYRDSVQNLEAVQSMANLRTDFEISQKQAEVDILNLQKRNQKIILFATAFALLTFLVLSFMLYKRYVFIRKTNKVIEDEKERSESLLLNILPEETAQELKEKGKVQAKKFESVTVLFTDFEGFTSFAEEMDPEQLVQSVDYYFSAFDKIIKKHDLEKIKTIGDAYMCAGGLPFESKDHPETMVKAALEINEFVNNSQNGHVQFKMRIGIHTGPVVAGVVGLHKFAYDIWGDTVNIASRIESNSKPGHINISEETYELIKDQFKCEPRGEIQIKNHGAVKMYFVQAPH